MSSLLCLSYNDFRCRTRRPSTHSNKDVTPRARVVLADDHAALLEYARTILLEEFDVVAAVGDGQAALDAAGRLSPDVVILDISMPVLSGLDVAAILNGLTKRPAVVFLTVYEGDEFLEAAERLGATGLVLKRQLGTHLLPAARKAALRRTGR
jgi:DNA-binding NarL/FixJ family response regulator